jgi:hypothetical protein
MLANPVREWEVSAVSGWRTPDFDDVTAFDESSNLVKKNPLPAATREIVPYRDSHFSPVPKPVPIN